MCGGTTTPIKLGTPQTLQVVVKIQTCPPAIPAPAHCLPPPQCLGCQECNTNSGSLLSMHKCPFLPRCQAIMPPSPVRHKPARCPPPPHVQCNMQLPPKRTRICHCQCHQTTAATLRWWRGAPSAHWLRTGLLLRCRCRHRDQHLLGQRRLFFIRCTASNAILRNMWH